MPGVDFPIADIASTGQVMEFRVTPSVASAPTTPPMFLQLPAIIPLPAPTLTRRLALVEEMSEPFLEAPVEALLCNSARRREYASATVIAYAARLGG